MSRSDSAHKSDGEPPGAVSDQNGEEAQGAHGRDQTGANGHTGPSGGDGRHEQSEAGGTHGSVGGSSKQVPGKG